jgi:hypothetical protein
VTKIQDEDEEQLLTVEPPNQEYAIELEEDQPKLEIVDATPLIHPTVGENEPESRTRSIDASTPEVINIDEPVTRTYSPY